MEQFGNELKKVLKAGLGAVATGAEMAQEAIENLSKKGEPLYQQAKSAVTDAADKIRQAVNDSGIKEAMAGKPRAAEIIDEIRVLSREDWALIRAALDEFEAMAPENDETYDGCVEAEEADDGAAPAEEAATGADEAEPADPTEPAADQPADPADPADPTDGAAE